MSLLEDDAIVFHDVCKIYRLYQTKWQMVKDVCGIKIKQTIPEFHALKNVNFRIKKGERIGLIGRNGAGKSTLLKLITGNFAQTTGSVMVNGKVQALMNTGIGFHPDFTGLENIKASLLYNGLSEKHFNEAIGDVIDFVELGDFLHQPLKTYSLGMQSRLYFAVATAIQPEILIVDEVLGAGDAYFSAKSADRMKKLTNSGCTLILVSHSTQQVLQFCDKAMWLERGEVVMQGEAIETVKAYEAFSKALEIENASEQHASQSVIQSTWLREKLLNKVISQHHTNSDLGSQATVISGKKVSRWQGHTKGLQISQLQLLDKQGQVVNCIKSGEELTIEMVITADSTGDYDVYFMILLFTEDGRWLSRHCSEKYEISLSSGEEYCMKLNFTEVLLGNGNYIFSAGIYQVLDLHDLSTAKYYDLISRSFELKVQGRYWVDDTLFYHPATWQVKSLSQPVCKV